jgi:uncharacterized damage-inducible protein DinB
MQLTPADGFRYYISLVPDDEVQTLFKASENTELLASLTEKDSAHRYAPEKWSIKQIVGHLADHERIMIYRALRFSRKDKTVLPGYDQELFVKSAHFDELPYTLLLEDFRNVRKSTITFIEGLTEHQLAEKGTASKYEVSVSDVLKATIGHELHHIKILKERYLPVTSAV